MTSIEFGKLCRPINLEYKKKFGYIPCIADYICSQEEFYNALRKAVEENEDIGTYIEKRPSTTVFDSNIRY